jgi:hypothetical protein
MDFMFYHVGVSSNAQVKVAVLHVHVALAGIMLSYLTGSNKATGACTQATTKTQLWPPQVADLIFNRACWYQSVQLDYQAGRQACSYRNVSRLCSNVKALNCCLMQMRHLFKALFCVISF